MEELSKMLAELKPLMGKDDPESVKRKEEITSWLVAHKTDENKQAIEKFIDDGLDEQVKELNEIRDQLKAEQYKLLPISYIAKKYFGKSSAWLYQRINGTKVRGRVYTLNEEQKSTFNHAIQDIANTIGSIRIA